MTDIPSTLAMTQALGKQAISHSVLKQSAEREQQLADILEQTVSSAPVSDTHGTNIDLMV